MNHSRILMTAIHETKRRNKQMFGCYSEKKQAPPRKACRWRQGPLRTPNLKCQLQRHLPLRMMPSPSISTSQLWFSTLPVTIEPPRGACLAGFHFHLAVRDKLLSGRKFRMRRAEFTF